MTLAFEQFLIKGGLTLKSRRGPQGEAFGNWHIKYANADFDVTMALDRGDLSVTITDRHFIPPDLRGLTTTKNIDVSLIRDLIEGGAVKPPLKFDESMKFVQANWGTIETIFSPQHREETHRQLQLLARERLKQALPAWPEVILDFEQFLQERRFVCTAHEAPDRALGDRILVYENDVVRVRITSRDGWRFSIAASVGTPIGGFDIRTIRTFLRSDQQKFQFCDWFAFARENWQSIVELFLPPIRQRVFPSLEPLERETQTLLDQRRAEQQATLERVLTPLGDRRINRCEDCD
jgi:hypothetical protein